MNYINAKKNRVFNNIDLAYIISLAWKKVFRIVFVGLLSVVICFSVANYIISPTYASSIMLYVNNSSIDVGDLGFSISSSELTAAQQLVKTYTEILKNRETLEMLISKTGVDYSWQELYKMINATSANETEIIRVTVTGKDPYETQKIANGISEILPARVDQIIEGASMEIVDTAVADLRKVAPSLKMYTFTGFIEGAILYMIILIFKALTDTTIHSEDDILNEYGYPVLAKIPDLLHNNSGKHGYYYKNKYYRKNT